MSKFISSLILISALATPAYADKDFVRESMCDTGEDNYYTEDLRYNTRIAGRDLIQVKEGAKKRGNKEMLAAVKTLNAELAYGVEELAKLCVDEDSGRDEIGAHIIDSNARAYKIRKLAEDVAIDYSIQDDKEDTRQRVDRIFRAVYPDFERPAKFK